MSKQRTDQQIIDETNELAKEFLMIMGYRVPDDFKFYSTDQCHPKIHTAWELAKKAQEWLTDTEVENALAALEIDDSCYYTWTKKQQREWDKANNKIKVPRAKKIKQICQHPRELLDQVDNDPNVFNFKCRGCGQFC